MGTFTCSAGHQGASITTFGIVLFGINVFWNPPIDPLSPRKYIYTILVNSTGRENKAETNGGRSQWHIDLYTNYLHVRPATRRKKIRTGSPGARAAIWSFARYARQRRIFVRMVSNSGFRGEAHGISLHSHHTKNRNARSQLRTSRRAPAYPVKKGMRGMPAYRITVDLSDRKLYLYDGSKLIKSYPVGIGKILSKTPQGDYLIVNKQPNPGGPYGAMWMGLSRRHYGIHGTNRPASIGQRVSRGCIRMHNADVLELAKKVPLGTHVTIRA